MMMKMRVVDLDDVNKDEVSAKGKNVADAEQIALEQQNDKSLALCFSLAERDKAGYYIRDQRKTTRWVVPIGLLTKQ